MKTTRNLILLFVPLIFISMGSMVSLFSIHIPYRDWVRLILSFLGLVGLLIALGRTNRNNNVFLVLLLFFSLLILLSTFFVTFADAKYTAHDILDLGDSVLWVGILAIAYNISLRGSQVMEKVRFISLLLPIYLVLFLNVRLFLISGVDDTSQVTMAYYLLFLLPFVFLLHTPLLRWGLIIVVLFSLLLAGKRAGFIAFFVTIFVYLLFNISGKKSSNFFTRILLTLFALTLVYLLSNFFVQENSLSIYDRLGTIRDDEGSGRGEIYMYTWNMIQSSDFVSLLFGHGYNAVSRDSIFELSAHTDLLEVLYDYGIVGFILYILLVVRLVVFSNKIKLYLPQYFRAYVSSISLFIVISLFSHLIIFPTYFLFLCAFWGLLIGEYVKAEHFY